MEPHKLQYVAILMKDGTVSVMSFILDPRLGPNPEEAVRVDRPATRENIQADIDKTSWKDQVVDFYPVDALPQDRTYRYAWTFDGQAFGHDLGKARELHRDILRRARVLELDQLDTQYMIADERGDAAGKKNIAAQKQKLRDVTADPRIEAAQTVEDLKALTLDVLTK